MATAVQKIAVVLTPVAAIWLGCLTADDAWKDRRPQESWDARMRQAPAAAAPDALPGPGKAPGTGPAPAPGTGGEPATARGPAPKPPGPAKPPAPKPAPAPPKPAPDEVPFTLPPGTRLASCRGGEPLKAKAEDRFDLILGARGMVRFGRDVLTVEGTVEILKAEEKRATSLLLLLADVDTPWTPVRDLLAAAAGGGWKRIALATSDPAAGAALRLLPVGIPKGEGQSAGQDAVTLRVDAEGKVHAGDVTHGTAAALEKWARERHAELADFYKDDYADDVDTTLWTVEGGDGATAGGVIAALDALRAAGVKVARIAGVEGEKK